MKKPPARKYYSAMREHQAILTRIKIADAAEALLLAEGYAGMTVEAIAKEAGVSPQTVYAVFGSKRGIIAELLDRSIPTQELQSLYQSSIHTTDFCEGIRLTVQLIRQFWESQNEICALLRGAGVLDPELALLEKEREAIRLQHVKEHVEYLLKGRVTDDYRVDRITDMLWSLGSKDLYRMIVSERNWAGEEYEQWLYGLLINALSTFLGEDVTQWPVNVPKMDE